MNKQIIVLLSLIFTGMITAIFYYFSTIQQENVFLNSQPLGEEESIVYLGDKVATNEIVFLFDYSCRQCFQWMNDVYPQIQELIEEGEVKFRTQSLVFENELSYQLASFDQNIKQYYPYHYFKIFPFLIAAVNEEDLDLVSIVNEIIAVYQLDEKVVLGSSNLDVIHLTRSYTREIKVDTVPTVLVNGEKLEDPFSIEDIVQEFD